MIQEIANEVSAKTGLPPEMALMAVTAAMDFLKTKLPEPFAGMLGGMLSGQTAPGGDTGDGSGQSGAVETIEHELEEKAMSALGGLFGSK